jgi:hypothetical protein
MTDVDRLLADYVREHRAGGEADPAPYLERAAAGDRKELAALIDAYLAQAPRRAFDEADFRGSSAEAVVEGLQRSLTGTAGLWPVVLPRLRENAGLKRRELVERLARSLGVGENTAKVGRYYHEMEQGLLPSPGVSDRVLEALARLVGSTAGSLREAGEAIRGGAERPPGGMAFARAAYGDVPAELGPPPGSPPTDDQWDEVDQLFRGGD